MPLKLPTGDRGKKKKRRENPARFYQTADELAHMIMEERDSESRGYIFAFQEKLDIFRKCTDSYNVKDSVLELLLCAAAGNNNTDAFSMLLSVWEPEEKEGIVRIPVRFPINPKMIPYVKKIYQYLEKTVKRNAFITDQPRYLDVLLQKLKIRSHGFSVRTIEWKDRKMYTNAPDIYVAILTGNIGMTDYLLGKEGGREGLVYRMEWQNGYTGIFNAGIRERPEGGFEVEFADAAHNSKGKFTFHDPFTAAVISGDRKMIEYISEKFPEVTWNRCLAQAIARSDEDLTEYLAAAFPEVMERISFRTIYRGKNMYLTGKYLEEHRTDREKCIAAICSALDEEREWMCPGAAFDIRDISVTGEPAYYKLLLEMIPDPEIKCRIRKNIVRYILSNQLMANGWPQEDQREEEQSRRQEMLEVFLMADTGMLDNYMESPADNTILQDFMWQASILAKEFEKSGIKLKIGYIDLYSANRQTVFYEENLKDFRRIMKYFKPECLRPESDGFNELLIGKNNVGLIRNAVQEGYIGPENALALYDYAAVQPHINEQILQTLIRISLESRSQVTGRTERRKS